MGASIDARFLAFRPILEISKMPLADVDQPIQRQRAPGAAAGLWVAELSSPCVSRDGSRETEGLELVCESAKCRIARRPVLGPTCAFAYACVCYIDSSCGGQLWKITWKKRLNLCRLKFSMAHDRKITRDVVVWAGALTPPHPKRSIPKPTISMR